MTEESTVNMISRNMHELGLAPGRNKSRGSKCAHFSPAFHAHASSPVSLANQRIVPLTITPRPAGPAAAGSISLTYHQSSPMQQQHPPHARFILHPINIFQK